MEGVVEYHVVQDMVIKGPIAFRLTEVITAHPDGAYCNVNLSHGQQFVVNTSYETFCERWREA